MNIKGSFPLLVLHLLAQGPSHGYQIARQIRQASQGALDITEGTLYPTLHTLERQGFLEAYEVDARGRMRRTYRLTDSGRQRLAEEQQAWQAFIQAVECVLAEGRE